MAYKIIKLPELKDSKRSLDYSDGLDWNILYGLLDPTKISSFDDLDKKFAKGISVIEIKAALYLNCNIIASEIEIEEALVRLEEQKKIKRKTRTVGRFNNEKEKFIIDAYPSW